MGSWQLEVMRMTIYVFTPVAAFYFFHQIEDFHGESMQRFKESLNKSASPSPLVAALEADHRRMASNKDALQTLQLKMKISEMESQAKHN